MAVALVWAVGIAMYALRVGRALGQGGGDFRAVWTAVDAFLRGQAPYAASGVASPPADAFLYPPSSLLLLAPFGMLRFSRALPFYVLVDAAAILLAGMLCLRLFRLPWASYRAALIPAVIALFAPVTQELYAANVNGLVLLGESAALLAAARERWRLAGCLLGLTFAIKPVLLPLLLLPVLERRWTSAALAGGIPVLLSVIAFPLMVEPWQFVRDVMPDLLLGGSALQNVSLRGSGTLLGLPVGVVTGVRLIVLAVSIVILWRLWRRSGDATCRLVNLASVVIAATFLCASIVRGYYGVYLLPLLVSAMQGGPFFGGLGVVAFYCLGGPDVKLWLLAGARGVVWWQVRVTLGLLLVLLGLGRTAFAAAGPAQPR
jgi:arabinofuranan 3-O-arabinosyltransferase